MSHRRTCPFFPDLALSAQSINNDGGRIVADRDLNLTAGQLLGNGEAGAGRDLSASLQGDFVNTAGAPRFTAQRDLAPVDIQK